MKTSRPPHDPSEQEIQHAAYHLWQEQGRPAGRDLDIWLTAQESLKHRLKPVANARSAKRAQPPPRNAEAAVHRRR